VIRETFIAVVVVAGGVSGTAYHSPVRNFDSFGDVDCESEEARLDNLAVALQNDPQSKAAIIFYGGQIFRGKLPRRGEAAARAARIKPYLVNRRGIPREQILVIDGGYMKEWNVEIWIVPSGAEVPEAHPTIRPEEIRFRKGRVNTRTFQCRV